MSANRTPYAFRGVLRSDLPMLRRWLKTPEVVRWWGDPDEQARLLEEDLANPLMVMRIVTHEGAPFAYVQDYDVHSWPQPHLAKLAYGARAIDAFVGEPAMIGQGHGRVFLRLLAERLIREGAPLVAIDPDLENVRARSAYAAAGFREIGAVQTVEGPALLMTFGD